MPLETASFIFDLVSTNPPSGDLVAQGDDHLRLLKAVLQTTFPNAARPFRFPSETSRASNMVATIDDDSKLVRVDTTAGNITITLPDHTDVPEGYLLFVEKVVAANSLVVARTGADTLDGATSITLAGQWDWAVLWASGGADWGALVGHRTISTAAIADGSVTNAKMADMAENRFKGRIPGSGSGPPTDLTPTQTTVMLDIFTTSIRGVVPGPSAAEIADAKVMGAAGSWAFAGAPQAIFRDQKAAGTAGGGFTSGSWVTRALQTSVRNVNSFATLAANQISLPAGTYLFRFGACAYRTGPNQTRLRNITDSTTVASGQSSVASNGGNGQSWSEGWGITTIAGVKVFELQHQANTTEATDGLGIAANFGEVEVYAEVAVWRV